MTEAQEAKAEAAAAKARAKALRPWYRKKRTWFAAAIVVIIGASIAGGSSNDKKTPAASAAPGIQSNSNNTSNPPAADVTLSECVVDSVGFIDMPVTIINHSSKRSNYLIEFAVVDSAGVKVGDGVASSNNVDPGQTAKEKGVASVTDVSGAVTCKVTNVERYSN